MNTQLSKWSLKQCGLVSKNHWNCLEVLRTSIPLNILCHHHSIDIWNCGPLVAWRGAVSSAFQSYQNLENNSGRCLRPATGQYAGHMAPYIGTFCSTPAREVILVLHPSICHLSSEPLILFQQFEDTVVSCNYHDRKYLRHLKPW